MKTMNVNRSEQIERKEVHMNNKLRTKSNTFVCTRTRMLDFLIERGWEPYKVGRDFKCPTRYVWLFDSTDQEFQDDVMEYFEMCANRNS